MPARHLALLLILLLFEPASATPVRVLSRSVIGLDIQKRWDRLAVTGTLQDDSGHVIPAREITLTVPAWGSRTALTDAAGRFALSLDAADLDALARAARADPSAPPTSRPAELTFSVRFGGDSLRGATTAVQSVDLSRETLQLQVALAPPRLATGEAPRVLAVLRHGAEPASDMRLVTTIEPIEVARPSAPVEARMFTGPDGRATFRSFEPPAPGRYRVVVRYAGNERFNAVEASRSLDVTVRTHVSLTRVAPGLNALGDPRDGDPRRIRVRGRLLGGGQPMAGAVTLALGESAYDFAVTGPDGRFDRVVDLSRAATRFGPAESRLRAIYTPKERWELGSVSPALTVNVPPPPRVPVSVYWIPLLFGAGLALTFWSIRAGLWRRLVSALSERRRPRFNRLGSAGDSRARLIERLPTALPLTQGARLSLSGQAWDLHVGRPLPSATARLLDGQGKPRAWRTDSDGRFDTGPLDPGSYTLTLTAPGFLPQSLPVTLPHRGLLASFRVSMTPLRAISGAAYAGIVDRLLGPDRRFGAHTPRQLQEPLGRALADPGAAQALTAAFEDLYYRGDHRVSRERHEALLGQLQRLAASELP